MHTYTLIHEYKHRDIYLHATFIHITLPQTYIELYMEIYTNTFIDTHIHTYVYIHPYIHT